MKLWEWLRACISLFDKEFKLNWKAVEKINEVINDERNEGKEESDTN